MPRKAKKRKRLVVVDTSVLVAGISGFKEAYTPERNLSADLLYKWAKEQTFVWLVSEDILDEYKEVLRRLRVRSHLIGRVVNLIRERAEEIRVRSSVEISPDPKDDPFCLCAEQGKADFIVTLNLKDFPQGQLKATVVSPERLMARR
ncbi:MAG TPA: putative toxin-antitoxin system toxin component, PIN family [Candidatus Dormibacteraeota bacterium]|nr:putative toxin-antitoxin system toxin component, PIN family [Candidatus Dormibacteraeota bacterium]